MRAIPCVSTRTLLKLDSEIKNCDNCTSLSKFTYKSPQWSPISHWIFRRCDKKRVFAVMCLWMHGTIFSQLPRDIAYMIIQLTILPSDGPSDDLWRKLRNCDTCTVAMTKLPKCSICIAEGNLTMARNNLIKSRMRGNCANCKIGKVYLCSLHKDQSHSKCERCVSRWKTL
jgi:hypothetical protein